MNKLILTSLIALAFATSSFAQDLSSLSPVWNYKKAEKKVRVIKLELLDRTGKPAADQVVNLKCSDGAVLSATTNKDGIVSFKRKISQKLQCMLLTADQQLIKRIDFRQYEPTTVAYLSFTGLLPSADKKKKSLVKNKHFTSRVTDLKVFLYVDYKRKKAQFKNIILTCLTEGGTRKAWEQKTKPLVAVARFEEIPYGSRCFIQVEMKKGQAMLKGMVDLTESDHTFTNELHIHINIPNGKGNGNPGGEEQNQGESNQSQLSDSNESTPQLAETTEQPVVEAAEQVVPAEQVPAQVVTVSHAPYRIVLSDCKTNLKLAGQSVTLYDPLDDATLVLSSDASGNVAIDPTLIIPGREYLVFLGSDGEPVATRNFLVKMTFGVNDRVKPACFDIGPIQYHFPNDRYDLNPDHTIIQELDSLAAVMREYPNLRVTVEGYTDSNQTDQYNMVLSRNRSESIRNYLIQKGGIAEDKIEIRYYGESKLIYNTDGTENMPASRRVEVKPYWKE